MMMQYDGFKRPSAQQVLSHPYFTKSIINTNGNLWGAQSLREKNTANVTGGNNLYKPVKNNVFNIQNKTNIDFKDDIDLEFDNDINEIMNKDFNKSLRPQGDNKEKNSKSINNNEKDNKNKDSNPYKANQNISGLNKNIDEFDVFGITPSPNDKKNTPKIDPNNKRDDDFGSIFSNQAIRNQNHYNSHSSGVLGKEVGMPKFNTEFGMNNNNKYSMSGPTGNYASENNKKMDSVRDNKSFMSNVGLRGVGTQNVYNSSHKGIINNNNNIGSIGPQPNEWQI